MRRTEVSALEADCDRADLVVAKIELARDLVNEAIANLEEAAKLSPEAAESSAESAAELHVVVHDFITGNALYVAREAAERAHVAVGNAYPQDDVAGWLAAASRHAAE